MTNDSLSVIPSPEHRKGTDPGVVEIGKVNCLNGDVATVYVIDDAVGIDRPVMLLHGEFVKLIRDLTEAGWMAAVNEGQSAMDDGGTP